MAEDGRDRILFVLRLFFVVCASRPWARLFISFAPLSYNKNGFVGRKNGRPQATHRGLKNALASDERHCTAGVTQSLFTAGPGPNARPSDSDKPHRKKKKKRLWATCFWRSAAYCHSILRTHFAKKRYTRKLKPAKNRGDHSRD